MAKTAPLKNTFKIPEPYCWDKEFETFYQQIDDEHKTLFQGVFKVATEKNQAALKYLTDVTTKHFTNEEAKMLKNKYSDYDEHKKMHTDFLDKVGSWTEGNLNQTVIDYAKDWLVDHIKTTDFKYKGKLPN